MDKYSVKFTNGALSDIDRVYGYIAKTLQAPEAALRLVDRIEEAIFSLEYMPFRCPVRKTGAFAKSGYRQLFIENYTAVYTVNEVEKTVVILTVRYFASHY